MLSLPRHVNRSVTKHNSRFEVFCDWLEASVLLDDGELSQSDVVDTLVEEHIYDGANPDFCSEYVTSAWKELRRRLSWTGKGTPIGFKHQRMEALCDWTEALAHSFCLVLGLAPHYSGWVDAFGPDYTEQGALFEELTREAMQAVFHDWEFTPTGWSTDRESKIHEVVPRLATALCEETGNLDRWANELAHESGLDLVWHRRFPDGRGGFPVYLAQCASGADWPEKLHTPDLAEWKKLIDWQGLPAKAFALPFALLDGEFRRRSNKVQGLLLDRYRILSPSADGRHWLSRELSERLKSWLDPRVRWLRRPSGT